MFCVAMLIRMAVLCATITQLMLNGVSWTWMVWHVHVHVHVACGMFIIAFDIVCHSTRLR